MVRLKTLNDMIAEQSDLLSFVTTPDGLDSNLLRSAIVDRCGDVAPYYQQATKFMVYGALWFSTHTWLFDHALNIVNAQYSPIENYNRNENLTEEITRNRESTNTDTNSGSDVRNVTGATTLTDGGTTTTEGSNGATSDTTDGGETATTTGTSGEHKIAAFNSAGYENADSTTENTTETVEHGKTQRTEESGTTAQTITHGKTQDGTTTEADTFTHGHILNRDASEEETESRTNTNHISGNIGVTTNQQMITEELDLIRKFAIYDFIASAFESDNFICVYDDYERGSAYVN